MTTGTSTTTKTYSYQIMEGVREITGPAGIIRSAYMDFGLVHIFLYLNKYSDFSIFLYFLNVTLEGLDHLQKGFCHMIDVMSQLNRVDGK